MTRKEAIEWQHRLYPTKQWYRKEENDPVVGTVHCHWGHTPTLCEIALDLRMSCNGAADPWKTEDLKEVVAMLKARAETWDKGIPRDEKMDDAIRQLVICAIEIGEQELKGRESE